VGLIYTGEDVNFWKRAPLKDVQLPAVRERAALLEALSAAVPDIKNYECKLYSRWKEGDEPELLKGPIISSSNVYIQLKPCYSKLRNAGMDLLRTGRRDFRSSSPRGGYKFPGFSR
jgi:hypothetical protein